MKCQVGQVGQVGKGCVSLACLMNTRHQGVWGKVENREFLTAVKNKIPAAMAYYSEYAPATRQASKIWSKG